VFVGSFYQFIPLVELSRLQNDIQQILQARDVVGTLLIAREGINASVAHTDKDRLINVIENITELHGRFKFKPIFSTARNEIVFDTLQVNIRTRIVTSAQEYDFSLPISPRVSASQWDRLLNDEEVLVLDIRNHYESRIGRFTNAQTLDTQTFAEIPEQLLKDLNADKEKTIATYCTGGIRCEKVNQILTANGFRNVLQLDRGILGYFDSTENSTQWQGECFVFDKRVSVTPQLTQGTATLCIACRAPLLPMDLNTDCFEYGISCPYCVNELTVERRSALEERLFQLQLAEERAAVTFGNQ